VEQAALRYTPAGLPALDLTLEHQGQSMEAGSARRVDLKLRALALGEMAKRLQLLPAGQSAVFNGFLAPTRNGKGVVMHITGFESVSGA
jgi:primosomal replication protein N